MNLYLRLLWTGLKAMRAPRLGALEAFELELRVLPNDIDLNGHLNNARYLALVDLALLTLFVRSGFGRLCIERKWRPMAGGSIIHYRRALEPFEAFTLRFTPVAWDEFWSYSRFEFIRDGQVCATGFTKGAAVGKQGLVRSAQAYEALGQRVTSPAMPKDLAAWVAADALLGVQAKHANAEAQRLSN